MPRRTRARPLIFLLAGALAVGAVGCRTPVTADNRPTVPGGQSNGALTAGALVTVNGCTVGQPVANALRGLLAAAAEARTSLLTASCYRTYAAQVTTRESWCARDACQMAAVPGTSNHGWGKAVDFGAAAGLTFDSPTYRWLATNAWIFGWNHPAWAEPNGSAPEPWHWEWVGDGGTLYPGRLIGPQ
jgi:hypothetical protein